MLRPKALTSAFDPPGELRELQQQLRMLAFNQQALLADSAQQLLYLAKAQATLRCAGTPHPCPRRPPSSTARRLHLLHRLHLLLHRLHRLHRLRRLRRLRRHRFLGPGVSSPPRPSNPALPYPYPRPGTRSTRTATSSCASCAARARGCRCLDALHTELRQQSALAAQPPPAALQAEHADAPRRSRGSSRRRAERAERAERRGARGEPYGAPQPPPSPEAQHAPVRRPRPRRADGGRPERIKLRDDEIATAGGGGGGGGGGGAAAAFGGSRAPAELVQLVGLACSPPLRSSPQEAPEGRRRRGGAEARRKARPATAAAVAAAAAAPAPGLPADHVLYPGLPADLVAAYAPPPPRPSTASRRRDEGAEAGGGTPRAGSPTNHKAMAAQLRQPALQAALASALWQVLHEHNGQQLLATPVPK